MEANENSIPQTGRVEDEYVRIGTTLFRILNQPMMNGSFRNGVEDEYLPTRP